MPFLHHGKLHKNSAVLTEVLRNAEPVLSDRSSLGKLIETLFDELDQLSAIEKTMYANRLPSAVEDSMRAASVRLQHSLQIATDELTWCLELDHELPPVLRDDTLKTLVNTLEERHHAM